ncbi:hypothetical protein [uncultured Flavobacterium sp.]|uniref:hypothetical protein n=1 Tax=uncultured Flavobacterium sp. TaxID=165435 RepID=UPI0030EDB872|tara:strand:+ start:25647 stop:26564 length:918 start_codon:yes stop_codon:yes gene_type:complete
MKKDKQYTINNFPKNINTNYSNLSLEQILIRKNVKENIYLEKYRCRTCSNELSIDEFYIKDKNTGRRATKCRDCQMKDNGILEIGKKRFSDNIFTKGFKKCSNCKEIKKINKFHKNKNLLGGFASICKLCSSDMHSVFQKTQTENIGDSYIKQYQKRKYSDKNLTEELKNKIKKEILIKRSEKYFLDGKGFNSLKSFARYVSEIYNIKYHAVVKRIGKGNTEKECTIPEREYRMLKNKLNKGKIKVTDVITKEVLIYKNTQDQELLKMFSNTTISRCIKSGNQTRVTKKSKYRNPCLIERIYFFI